MLSMIKVAFIFSIRRLDDYEIKKALSLKFVAYEKNCHNVYS